MPIGLTNSTKTIDTWAGGILKREKKAVPPSLLEALIYTLNKNTSFDKETVPKAIDKAKIILDAFDEASGKTVEFEADGLHALRDLYIENDFVAAERP